MNQSSSQSKMGPISVFADGAKIYRTALDFKTEGHEQFFIRLAKNGAVGHNPLNVIRTAIKTHKEKVTAAWSGGRCSTVMLYMALKINPDIKVMFINTGVEFPETINYVERIIKDWNLNIQVIKPERTFWDIVKEYGFPSPRKSGISNNKRKSGDIPPCCTWLKEKPIKKYCKLSGVEAFITGMRAGESKVRALVLRQKGEQFYYVKSQDVWKYHPLAFWSTRQVSDYIVKYDIPINLIYEKIDRCGCWPCTAFIGWRENLMKANPKLYEYLNKRLSAEGMLNHFYASRIGYCTQNG